MTEALRLVAIVSVFCLIVNSSSLADDPSWWTTWDVVETNSVVDDYAPAIVGQLKWFATNAYNELEIHVRGGAGTNVEAMVQGFVNSNNFCTVNSGQIKDIAEPIYDRLIEEGVVTNYPWSLATNTPADYAVANIGQMKFVFDFDLSQDSDTDGLVDWVESGTTNYVAPNDTGTNPNDSDSDDDGADDGDEVSARTDPNNDDVAVPTVVLTSPTNGYRQVWLP